MNIKTEPYDNTLKEIKEDMFPFFTKYMDCEEENSIWYFFKDCRSYCSMEIGCNETLTKYETIEELEEDLDIGQNIVVQEIVFR